MAATAKIATLQDLVHALDEHPEWVDELRVRLLTRELLELPQKLADFIAATEKRFVAVEARLNSIEHHALNSIGTRAQHGSHSG